MVGTLRRLSVAIDAASERLGAAVAWLTLAMVLIGAFNALARYFSRFTGWNLSSNGWLELQWYLFSAVFLLAASYALRCDAHVRVDVLYSRFPPKVRAWIDLLGSLLFLIPFALFALIVSWPSVRNSWAIREVSSDPGGLARYPIKTLIPIAFSLLVVQGISQAAKAALVLLGAAPEESSEDGGVERELSGL